MRTAGRSFFIICIAIIRLVDNVPGALTLSWRSEHVRDWRADITYLDMRTRLCSIGRRSASSTRDTRQARNCLCLPRLFSLSLLRLLLRSWKATLNLRMYWRGRQAMDVRAATFASSLDCGTCLRFAPLGAEVADFALESFAVGEELS